MGFSQLNFAQSAWLWGLLAIPAVLLLYALPYTRTGSADLLERFADRHLLPHLLRDRGVRTKNIRGPLLLWAVAWLCGVLAMAGPRWNYTEAQTFRAAQDLVVVLDLSQSMNAQDAKPSRMARAREEIEDLLKESRGASIGLVAYAAVPHMVTPLTDDVRTLENLLPALDTSLVTLQGDRLQPALEMAARMLKAEPGDSKSILVIGDGDFEETDFAKLAQAAGGATIYAMGIGTAAGTPVPGDDGDWLKDAGGKMRLFRLQSDRLQMLAAAGHGLYVEANYTDSDTRAILGRIGIEEDKAQGNDKSVRIWQERFYIPALALALLLLPFFRRRAVLPFVGLVGMTLLSPGHAHASSVSDLFLNREQQARVAYDSGDYKNAMANFSTPYRRGVAAYRAGAYAEAAALFEAGTSQENGLDALYNLGNAQLMQNMPEDAIASYEAVLKQRPGDASAQHNLAIARKMLAQKHSPPQQKPPQTKDQQDQGKGGGGSAQNNSQQGEQRQGTSGPQGGQGKNGRGPNQPPASGTGSPNQKQAQEKNDNQKAGQQQGGAKPQTQQEQPQQARQGQAQQQQARQQQAQQQQAHQQPVEKQPDQQAAQRASAAEAAARPVRPAGNSQTSALARLPQDVRADKRLDRLQSDPGSLLRNQFMIEDSESAVRNGTNP